MEKVYSSLNWDIHARISEGLHILWYTALNPKDTSFSRFPGSFSHQAHTVCINGVVKCIELRCVDDPSDYQYYFKL